MRVGEARDYRLVLSTIDHTTGEEDPVSWFPLGDHAQHWRRTIGAQGGSLEGSFQLSPASGLSESDLIAIFDNWLGHQIKEIVKGTTTFTGLVYEIDLMHRGVRRRRSLDDIWNAVDTNYKTWDYTGDNLVVNGSFEIAGQGGDDVVASWYENPDAVGSISQDADPRTGTYSLGMSAGAEDETGYSLPPTWVRQNINVSPEEEYSFELYCKLISGTRGGRWAIRDPNQSRWIIPPTPIPAGSGFVSTGFNDRVGVSDGEWLVFLMPPSESGASVRFDDVVIQQKQEVVYRLGFLTDENSIRRYGRREQVLMLDKYAEDTATAKRKSYLAFNGNPRRRTLSIGKSGETWLEIVVAGWQTTANWMLAISGGGGDQDLSDYLRAIAGSSFGLSQQHGGVSATAGDMQFIKAGSIAANDLQVPGKTTELRRPWEMVEEVTSLGDSDGNIYRAWVDPVTRRLNYAPIDKTQQYFLIEGLLHPTMSGPPVNPWLARPGVAADMAFRNLEDQPGAYLDQANHIWIEAIEMQDGWERPALQTMLLDETRMERLIQ